ncbi:MAG: sodium:solute symporter family protein, partial [Clostridia bacterium]|nr:sodium:solute symporter family protein [Clostridia bacterium]
LLLAYSFWAPAILVPLAAALRGIKADERTFFAAVVTGVAVCLCWNHLLGQPLGIDGSPLGTLANALVFFVRVSRLKIN